MDHDPLFWGVLGLLAMLLCIDLLDFYLMDLRIIELENRFKEKVEDGD